MIKNLTLFYLQGGGRDDLDQYTSSKEVKMKEKKMKTNQLKKIRFSNHFSSNDVFQCIGKFRYR